MSNKAKKPEGKEKKTKRHIPLSLLYERIAIVLFGSLALRIAKMYQLSSRLKKANVFVHPVRFASRLIMNTVIVGIISLLASALIFINFGNLYPKIGLLALVLPIIVLFTPALYFLLKILLLNSRISDRAHGVDSELPFFASYLTSMVVSGITPEKVIDSVSQSDLFFYIKNEARLIKRNMQLFGMDALSAIEESVKDHPSRDFRDFMLGYVSTVRGGGDVAHYLQIKTDSYFKDKERDLDKMAGRIGLVLSTYMVIFVIVELTINIIMAIQGIGMLKILQSVSNVMPMIILFNYILMPMITIMMIAIVSSILPKYPVRYSEPYLVLLFSVPIGMLVFSFLMAIGGYKAFTSPDAYSMTLSLLAVGLGFTVASIPPYMSWKKIESLERGLVENLAMFLTDLAEIRKTGLNPEKSIIYLSEKNYSAFNPILKKLSVSLMIGMNIKKSIKVAMLGYKNWFLRTIMSMLVDVIEFGGGTQAILDALASYGRKLSDFEHNLKQSLRSEMFLPYIGAILNIVSTIMIIYLMVSSINIMGAPQYSAGPQAVITVNPAMISTLAFNLLLSAILNSWLAGFLVGKSATTTVAGGFKHAIYLALVSLFASVISVDLLLTPLFR